MGYVRKLEGWMDSVLMTVTDVGNKYSTPDCPSGNCLRSHVNKTETMDSLILITKAGVETRKIVVGISSYGRSFRMSDPLCSGPMCTYTGTRTHSEAYKGSCTATSGYISNAEMLQIIDDGSYSIIKNEYDSDSDSMILQYGDGNAVDWVAYMDNSIKEGRILRMMGLNFAGTSNWAIDLNDDSLSTPEMDPDFPDYDSSYLNDIDCDPSLNPGNMEALEKLDHLPVRCQTMFALDILSDTIDDTLTLFDTNSKDYDDKFGYYADWVRDNIDPRLREFLNFRKDVKDAPGLVFRDCTYKEGGRHGTTSCTGMPHFWDNDVTWSVEFKVRDEKGFYDALEAKTGIQKDWIKWGSKEDGYDCQAPGDENVRPGGPKGGVSVCHKHTHTFSNFPMRDGSKDIKVGNPKEVINAAMPNITALKDSIDATYIRVGYGVYGDGSTNLTELEAISAYAMPIYQLKASVESMKEIKDIGEKAKEEKKKELITTILSIVFLVLPFIGEAIGPIAASAAQIARIISLIAEAGNAALTIAEIVQDPSSAPFAILGMIVGGGVGGGAGKMSKAETLGTAAGIRAGFKAEDLAKFPPRFKELEAPAQSIVKKNINKVCHRK